MEEKVIEIGNPELDFLFDEKKFKKSVLNLKNEDFESLLKLYDSYPIKIPNVGEVVTARYLGVNSDYHIFSVDGFKDNIWVDNKPNENKYLREVNLNDEIEILICDVNQENYFIRGSISELYKTRVQEELKHLDEGQPVKIYVRNINPAGYDVDLLHDDVVLPGFMPNTLAGVNKLYDPMSIVGKYLYATVESYSEDEGTYIVSRRKYLQSLIPDYIKNLEYGKLYKGHVTGTTPFGIFVEFNDCLTGMIHKTSALPELQEKINTIKPGTVVEFYIKEIIKEKIILTQVLRETLWDTIKVNRVLKGVVKEEKSFGVLVELDEETMGLIHTSELEKINKKFEIGEEIEVKVLAVDRENRKIYLTKT